MGEQMTFTNAGMGIQVNVNLASLQPGRLLEDRVILITGGNSGIGFEIAKKCAEQGAKVIVTGTNAETLAGAERAIGENCRSMYLNMRDPAAFAGALETMDSFFGPVNCLVNNAGVSLHEGDMMNVTEETWDAQMDINLKGPYFLTQAWIRYYRAKQLKWGRILMMASDASGMGSSIPYGLTKAGIASLTRGLAKKLVVEGVRINALAPGTTLTPMTEDFTFGEVCRQTTEGKRALFPGEIADLAVFLLSDLSTCVSGNVFGCSEANICFDNAYQEAETNP